MRLAAPAKAVSNRLGSGTLPAKVVRAGLKAAAFVTAVQLILRPPVNIFIFGIATGALYGLMAVGVILIYRTNRIINFAVAGLGAVPAVFAVLLQTNRNFSYWVALPLALAGGALLGALADIFIIRRFARAPRLILTVATLGLVQILAFIAIYIPGWVGSDKGIQPAPPTPWKSFIWRSANQTDLLTGDYVFAVVMVFLLTFALEAFFRFTRIGIALRASAENADRALLLGIPVRRVGTVAWMLAGLFAAVSIFLRAPMVGVPIDGSLGYNVLMYVLAAAVVARFDQIPTALFAGMGAGILEQASVTRTGDSALSTAIMLVVILGALLTQRKETARALDTGISTWQSVREFRPVPLELKNLKRVIASKAVIGALIVALAIAAPFLFGESRIGTLTLIPLYAIVAVSLVILTGWAGQISLGQFALVGVGAVTAGKLAADFNVDFFIALTLGAVAGAVVSVLIGLPALRVQGLYLAVTTLAFGGAMQYYFLNKNYPVGELVLPGGEFSRIVPPFLWERIDLNQPRAYYYFTVVFLAAILLAARSFRRNRSGRVLISARENSRAAPAYAINLARSRLSAFAVSGAIAATGGVLIAYQQGSIDPASYGIGTSIEIFVITVIGGLTSLSGAVLGAIVIQAVKYFGEEIIEGMSLLVTGPGLLLVLLFLPGGFAEGFYRVRDWYLKRVALRKNILVPSLVADRRVEQEATRLILEAEKHAVEEGGFDELREKEEQRAGARGGS